MRRHDPKSLRQQGDLRPHQARPVPARGAASGQRPGGLRQACRLRRDADGKSGDGERGQRHRRRQLLGIPVARPAARECRRRRTPHPDVRRRLYRPASGRRQRHGRAASQRRRDHRAARDARTRRRAGHPQPAAAGRTERGAPEAERRGPVRAEAPRSRPQPAIAAAGRASIAPTRARRARSRSARTRACRARSQHGRAIRPRDGAAPPEQQALLRRTRDRFLGYRDRCPNRSASATPMSGGCARSATSWKAVGSRRDKSWISAGARFRSGARRPIVRL